MSTAAIQAGRDALIEQLTQYGITGAEAQAYADKLGLIPENVNTAVTVETSGAYRAINDLKSSLAAFQNSGYGINISGYIKSLERADGGILPGPPSRVDNMLIRAASGEFVVNAMATAVPANRAMLEYINSMGTLPAYANGGYVQPQYAVESASFRQSPAYMGRSGDTFAPTFMLAPPPGRSLADQTFEASRRMKLRRS